MDTGSPGDSPGDPAGPAHGSARAGASENRNSAAARAMATRDRSVRWDEQNLEENERIKAALNPQKIDEPKTPWMSLRRMSDVDGDEGSLGSLVGSMRVRSSGESSRATSEGPMAGTGGQSGVVPDAGTAPAVHGALRVVSSWGAHGGSAPAPAIVAGGGPGPSVAHAPRRVGLAAGPRAGGWDSSDSDEKGEGKEDRCARFAALRRDHYRMRDAMARRAAEADARGSGNATSASSSTSSDGKEGARVVAGRGDEDVEMAGAGNPGRVRVRVAWGESGDDGDASGDPRAGSGARGVRHARFSEGDEAGGGSGAPHVDHEKFERHRREHYNMREAMIRARALLGDEGEDSEGSGGNEGLGESGAVGRGSWAVPSTRTGVGGAVGGRNVAWDHQGHHEALTSGLPVSTAVSAAAEQGRGPPRMLQRKRSMSEKGATRAVAMAAAPAPSGRSLTSSYTEEGAFLSEGLGRVRHDKRLSDALEDSRPDISAPDDAKRPKLDAGTGTLGGRPWT